VAALRESALGRLFGRAPDYGELYELLRQAGANIRRSTALLSQLISRWPEEDGERHDLVDCEHEGDRITHDIIHRLAGGRRWLRTPFGAGDGYALATALDDVLDNTEQAAAQLQLYGVEAPMEQAVQFAEVLLSADEHLVKALLRLCAGEEPGPHLVEVHRLENEGDRLLRDGVASLFAGGADPMVVIRWKDVFESLEAAVDACETVAHVIEGIMLKRRWR
jgi:uncharacterized protein